MRDRVATDRRHPTETHKRTIVCVASLYIARYFFFNAEGDLGARRVARGFDDRAGMLWLVRR